MRGSSMVRACGVLGAVAIAALGVVGCGDAGEPGGADLEADTVTSGDGSEDGVDDATDAADATPDREDALADAATDTGRDEVAEVEDAPGDTTADAEVVVTAPEVFVTVAQVPADMNGSRPTLTPDGPLTYHLRVNRAGCELDVVAAGTVDWSTLEVGCVDEDGAAVALGPVTEVGPWHRQVVFDGATPLPLGWITCSARLSGPLGAAETSYTFEAAELPEALDPFPTTDRWLVVTERDTFKIEISEQPDGTAELRSDYVAAGDGVDDFDAPFLELGLMSAKAPAAAAKVRDHLLRKVRQHVQAIFRLDAQGQPTRAGPDLSIAFEGDPGAPSRADFGAPGQRFSMIALTGDGDEDDQIEGTFGRALIDWNNQDVEDDTRFGLGVWPAALARAILRNPLGVLLLADYRPAQGGVPFGEAPGDELFLGLDVDVATLTGDTRSRAEIYQLVVDMGSLALASILAHEMGHSLGLVPYGAPPEGLFAGVEADFVVSLAPDAHIDTAGLNVMQTGGSLNVLEAFGGDAPAFEPLSWAYLRRQLVVGPTE